MTCTAYLSKALTPQNAENEIRNAVNSIPRHNLQEKLSLAIGDAEEFHRCLAVAIHIDSPKAKERALWW